MIEKELLDKALNIEENADNSISTLSIAIKGARELCGRDVNTGKRLSDMTEILERGIKNDTIASNKFLGTISYLIIIELIGKQFGVRNKSNYDNAHFDFALENFISLMNENQIKSLKNLRNSLAHTFSLGNDSELFELNYSDKSDQVTSKRREKNTLHTNHKEYTTIVYYENLCDLVEEMYQNLQDLHKNGELRISSKFKENDKIKELDFNSVFFVK